MNTDRLSDAMGEIRDDFIIDADTVPERKDAQSKSVNAWLKKKQIIYAAAACLCMVILGIVVIPRISQRTGSTPQSWSSSMTAADYFKNAGKRESGSSVSSSADLVMGPAALTIIMNDRRTEFESEGLIPAVPDHPEQSFAAEYNGDGSLYKLEFWWMRRGESIEEYSDLEFIVAPKELHEISDVIMIRVDSEGNELPPYITETVRDGISIFAEGSENENKTLTWQTDKGWYRICGCWKDSYDSMVELLDWFWEHPLDQERFAAAPAGSVIYSTRVEYPDAFSKYIPDFAALGYTAESEKVNLAVRDDTSLPAYSREENENTAPIWFEGIYTRGETRIRWTINTGADADAWAENIGRPAEITEAQLEKALSDKNSVNVFFNMPCMVTVKLEQGTAADVWEIIESMK